MWIYYVNKSLIATVSQYLECINIGILKKIDKIKRNITRHIPTSKMW